MPSSTHRTKRAFLPTNQSSLDTFFQPRNSTTTEDEENTLRTPALPPSIQSNLLSVGMRVRKSVPEGYKTHKLGFHDIRSAEIRLDQSNDADEDTQHTGSSARELQPFCGLLKVGGFAVQSHTPTFSGSINGPNAYMPLPCTPFDLPPSSQESTTSTASFQSTDSMPKRHPLTLSSNTSKRALPDEEDEETEEDLLAHQTLPSRPLARPTIRRRRSPRLAQRQQSLLLQQTSRSANGAVMPPVESIAAAADFEEAAFFKPELWRENEMDLENW